MTEKELDARLKYHEESLLLAEEKKYTNYITSTKNLVGILPDVNNSEPLPSKVWRFIRRVPPPERRVPELPRTPDDALWRYTHEVRGIGFTVFMHIFPQLRDQCVGFEAYGMGRDVIGDELYNELTRPFVQPPYELPASAFEEEATMMAGSDVGAAAAASSAEAATGSATAGSDALPLASRPAAAASASCADLPDEADDASEADHLLEGTGSYVRHRAAAMAAAAAVEKEVHTSSS